MTSPEYIQATKVAGGLMLLLTLLAGWLFSLIAEDLNQLRNRTDMLTERLAVVEIKNKRNHDILIQLRAIIIDKGLKNESK